MAGQSLRLTVEFSPGLCVYVCVCVCTLLCASGQRRKAQQGVWRLFSNMAFGLLSATHTHTYTLTKWVLFGFFLLRALLHLAVKTAPA